MCRYGAPAILEKMYIFQKKWKSWFFSVSKTEKTWTHVTFRSYQCGFVSCFLTVFSLKIWFEVWDASLSHIFGYITMSHLLYQHRTCKFLHRIFIFQHRIFIFWHRIFIFFSCCVVAHFQWFLVALSEPAIELGAQIGVVLGQKLANRLRGVAII